MIFITFATLRFVDRDMVMRYHWGMAAGHVYTHATPNNICRQAAATDENTTGEPTSSEHPGFRCTDLSEQDLEPEDREGDDPELAFENREDDFLAEEGAYDELGLADNEGLDTSYN
jgi:hypothetical protein